MGFGGDLTNGEWSDERDESAGLRGQCIPARYPFPEDLLYLPDGFSVTQS